MKKALIASALLAGSITAGFLAFQFAANPPKGWLKNGQVSNGQSPTADSASPTAFPSSSIQIHRASMEEFERLLTATSLDGSVIAQVISRLHPSDLVHALKLAEKATDGIRCTLVAALLARIAEEDPGGAVTLASHLPELSGRSEELEKQLQNWMRISPGEATKWAETQLHQALLEAAEAASDPSDDRDREHACIAIAKGWALIDPAAASYWVQRLPDSHQRLLALEAIFASWAKSDAKNAYSAASQLSEPHLRSKLYAQIGIEWAKNDVAAAMAWVRLLPSDEGGEAVRTVLLHLSLSSPGEAIAQAQAFDQEGGSETASFLMQQWFARDANAATQWVKTLPPGPHREAAFGDLLPAWAALQPEAAAAEVLASPNNEHRSEMLNVVATSWAKKDPVAAMTWALNSQDEAVSNAGVIQSIITQWVAESNEAVASWLNKLPQSRFRDEAIAAFARNIGAEHPQTALAWADTINEPSQRTEVLEGIALRWLEQDESEARQALAAFDLPAPLRERIFSQ